MHALDAHSLKHFIPTADLERITATTKPVEALSDEIRVELLHRYGGVWADATTMCMVSLDRWLPDHMETGFFAFANPGPGRMLASWFLAAEKGSIIVERWRQAVAAYWSNRQERDDYFWFHKLFTQQYERDQYIRALWDRTPKLPAAHRGHFSPNDVRLTGPITRDQLDLIAVPPSPVFKLTHKLPAQREQNSLLAALCGRNAEPSLGNNSSRRRLLLTWYGSFAGHGTIGDQRALEAATTHLVGRGHEISHATAIPIEIPGSTRVSWHEASPPDFDGIVFVCGPVLRSHPQTNALFERFHGRRLAGVSVSLMPPSDGNFANPFEVALAREGTPTHYGDLAVVAPIQILDSTSEPKRNIGLVLRGRQNEYGSERCRWRETEAIATELAREAASALGSARIIHIENHLARSGTVADEIEKMYRDCALVITSRYHGAIAALRNNVPFIAIDQIQGGAKVSALLEPLGWPHVYTIDHIDGPFLTSTSRNLVTGAEGRPLWDARETAIKQANKTLAALEDWVSTL